jgi:hypothetical protein
MRVERTAKHTEQKGTDMNSVQLDNQLQKIGYCLVSGRRDDESRWRVVDQRSHENFNCDTLQEVSSLLRALRAQEEDNGMTVVFDGADWHAA